MHESQSSLQIESRDESSFLRPPVSHRSLAAFALAPGRIVSLLIVLNLAITIPLAWMVDLIIDEAFTLHTTSAGIVYAFNQAVYFELQAPLYFVLLNIWRGINGSIFFSRLFSAICIALTIKVAAGLSQRLFKAIHPGWFAAIVALHSYAIWATTEIRLYAFGILLSSLLLLLFYDGFLRDKPRRALQAAYLLLSVVALYTQYYLGFLLVANACVLLSLRRWRVLLIYTAGMLLVGLCFTPMLLIVPGQVSTHTQTVTSIVPVIKGVGIISWHIKGFILPITPAEQSGHLEELRRWVFRLGYVLIGVALVRSFILSRFRRSVTTGDVVVWVVFLVTTLFYVAAIHMTAEGMLQERHSFVLFIPSTLLAFSLFAKVADWRARLCWLLIFLLFSLASLYYTYTPLSKNGKWRQTAAFIMESEQPGEPILVFHAGSALTLSHYYRGANALVPIPHENRFDTFDIRDYVLKDEQEINAALARVPGDHEQVWLVTDGMCRFMDVDYNCQGVEDFVEKYYTVERSETFLNLRARLLRRKSKGI